MSEWREDPIEELARELRQGAGAELRAEAEITEMETHLGRLRRRSLADVAGEAMNRGDTITVISADRTITGSLEFVGSDYVIVQTASEMVDARLTLCAFSLTRRRSGGHLTRSGSKTMKARLAEYEQTGEPLQLLAPSLGVNATGRISVGATDHIVLTADGVELFVPTDQIALVIRTRT